MVNSKKINKYNTKKKTIKKNIKKQSRLDKNIKNSKYTVKTENSEIEYTRIPVYANIQNRLNKIFKKQVSAFVIAPTPEERRKLITQIIGQYAVRQLAITARFYYIQPVKYAITNKIYNQTIHDMGTTVGKAIKAIQEFGYKVFIHGGTIRDIFINKDPTDIDLVFDRDVQSLEPLCKKEGWPCSIIDPRTQYINLGEDKGISLEGDNLKGKFLVPMHNHESTINDFAFDCQTNILIDISGHGLEDIVYRKIRLSPLPAYWEKWATSDFMGKRPLRYFKLIQKGFKPRDDGSYEFVVNFIKRNFDSLYEKPIKPAYPIPRIKHFLIVNITMGKIDPETGDYEFGANEGKLLGFLSVLKRHLGKDYFYRIMAHFNERDLELFHNKDVVTSIGSIIRNRNVKKAREIYESKMKKGKK
jgi:hypothetical protein